MGVSLLWAGIAGAAPPVGLVGAYVFTGEASCITSLTDPGFYLDSQNYPATPISPWYLESFSVQGVWTFNGDGTGTREGITFGVSAGTYPGVGSSTFQAPFTYTVSPDGTFTTWLTPPLTGNVLTGPREGQRFTIDQITLTGKISMDKKSLTIAAEEPQIETVKYYSSVGTLLAVHYRVCHRSRVLLLLQK